MEVPTIMSFSSLQWTVEQNDGIPVVGGSGAGGGLSGFLKGQSYSFTAEQIVDNPVPRPGVMEVFKVQQRFRSRSLLPNPGGGRQDFQPVQGSAASSSVPLGQAGEGGFRTFPRFKKSAMIPRTQGVGTGCRVELVDAVSSAGVSMVAQHGVRRLLLVAERQEWCFLVCSSGSPSSPVAWSSRWCRLCFPSVMEAFGRISCSTCLFVALFALGNLDFAFALVSSSPSVFGCCLWSTSYSGRVRCLVPQWIHVLLEALNEFHICSSCGNFRPEAFSLHSCTVDASSCSLSQRGSHFESGHYLYEFSMVAV